jgi:hypothetical protein
MLYRYCKNCFIRKWIIRKSRLTGKLTKVISSLTGHERPEGALDGVGGGRHFTPG